MAQKQGNSSAAAGRLDGSIGSAVTDAAFALGAGWGGAATISVLAGSTDQRGQCTITASATTPAQATATVTFTFVDGAYTATPFAFVNMQNSDSAITDDQPKEVVATTTTLVWKAATLPVSTKVYIFNWLVVA